MTITPKTSNGLDYAAIRSRVAAAAGARGVDPVPFVLLTDDEINEGAAVDWIASNLMGESLDWLIMGDPIRRVGRLSEYDSPLREAADLLLVLRSAAFGGISEMTGGDDAVGRIADMAGDRIRGVAKELENLAKAGRA